jgi:hypothetical protein
MENLIDDLSKIPGTTIRSTAAATHHTAANKAGTLEGK